MDTLPTKDFKSVEVIDPYSKKVRSCFLVKYEKQRYKTARIGTLSYYRNIEGNQADPLDGRVEKTVFSPGEYQPITREEMLLVTGGGLDIRARDGIAIGETGSIQDNKPRRCHNAYIYCCSMEYEVFPNEERMSHFGANEYIVIDEAESMAHNIAKELAVRGKTIEGKSFDPEIHYIKFWEAPVRYTNRQLAEIELPFNALDFFIYQKDQKFSVEQEYRFTWMVFEKETDLPIDVASDPIDIPINEYVGSAHVEFI